VLQLLYTLVEAREKAGADLPTLVVIAVGDLDYFERRGRIA
jgi:hypothetical protein